MLYMIFAENFKPTDKKRKKKKANPCHPHISTTVSFLLVAPKEQCFWVFMPCVVPSHTDSGLGHV